MEENNLLKFPYDFNAISEEEKVIIKHLYNVPNAIEVVRIGPKGYILYKPFQKEAKNIYNMPLRPGDVFVASFQRSGKTGGWRDYFDEEMTQEANQWIKDNLRDTDLRFPHTDTTV